MVVAAFLPTNGSVVEHQSHRLGNTSVKKLDPTFGEILLLVSLEFDPTLPNNKI